MIAIILAIVFFILGMIFLIIVSTIDKGDKSWAIFLSILFFGLSPIMVLGYFSGKPQAIHVYQGKTTLKVTYLDSISVDSVVVFK